MHVAFWSTSLTSCLFRHLIIHCLQPLQFPCPPFPPLYLNRLLVLQLCCTALRNFSGQTRWTRCVLWLVHRKGMCTLSALSCTSFTPGTALSGSPGWHHPRSCYGWFARNQVNRPSGEVKCPGFSYFNGRFKGNHRNELDANVFRHFQMFPPFF
jgi:hypothetical protein